MSKKVEVTPSELVLSAIFFLQQKDGVSAKEITKHICKKWGCKQSSIANEVKEALEKATENEIFVKKQGLYRIASGLGGNMKSIKKKIKKNRKKNVEPSDVESCEQLQDSCKCPENVDDPWLNSPSSHSDRISLEQIDMLKNKCDGDDDDVEDFLEEEDDELDFFADDQVPQIYDLKKECNTSVKTKPSCGPKGKRGAKGKSAGGKQKRRKVSKPRKKTNRRKKIVCSCKNSDSGSPILKSCQSCELVNDDDDDDLDVPLDEVPSQGDECDKQCDVNKRRNTGKKGKGANVESDDDSCNCNASELTKEDGQTEDNKEDPNNGAPKEDQAKKNPQQGDQIKRKGKEAGKSEGKEIDKTGGDSTLKKETKDRPGSPVKGAATPGELPPEKEWRRRKTKRERSSSLFRPAKKQVSAKDKQNGEQKSAKSKNPK